MRRWPCTVHAGDRCEIRRYKGEVLIALISVLDIVPLAIIYAVVYAYSRWLKVKCLISWPKLSRYIQGTYSSSSIYILRGRVVFLRGKAVFLKGKAVFLRGRVVVQSSRISALFTVYISLLVLGTSSTIS
jgi:hypothetical protein